MATPVVKRLISTEDYYKMAEIGMLKPDERVELINGEIYTMSPIGSRHAAVVNQLNRILGQIDSNDIISIQNPVRVDEMNEPEPDIAVLKFREDLYARSHPVPGDVLVIMEISDTSYEFDLQVKLPVYASCGIAVYWIVNLSENRIEVYENPVQSTYRVRKSYFPGDKIQVLEGEVSVSEVLIS